MTKYKTESCFHPVTQWKQEKKKHNENIILLCILLTESSFFCTSYEIREEDETTMDYGVFMVSSGCAWEGRERNQLSLLVTSRNRLT